MDPRNIKNFGTDPNAGEKAMKTIGDLAGQSLNAAGAVASVTLNAGEKALGSIGNLVGEGLHMADAGIGAAFKAFDDATLPSAMAATTAPAAAKPAAKAGAHHAHHHRHHHHRRASLKTTTSKEALSAIEARETAALNQRSLSLVQSGQNNTAQAYADIKPAAPKPMTKMALKSGPAPS